MNLQILEQRVATTILGGILGIGVLGSGCVAGPDGMTPLQRACTQRGSYRSESNNYATATPMPEPSPQQYSNSREESLGAGILKATSWLFGIHGDIVPAAVLDVAADVEARNAIISGQKEAAEIIQDGLGRQRSASEGQALPDGVERVRLLEFGTVHFMVGARCVDFNRNGEYEPKELIPSRRMSVNGGLYVACELSGIYSFYKPRVKIFDEEGKLIEDKLISDERIQSFCGGTDKNIFPIGKYIIAFFGQVPPPGRAEQRPYGKQGVPYFLHAIPFEITP